MNIIYGIQEIFRYQIFLLICKEVKGAMLMVTAGKFDRRAPLLRPTVASKQEKV